MSVDPLISANDERRELQRLLKENRELREANASLRVAAEAKAVAANNNSGSDKIKNANISFGKVKDGAGRSEESVGGKTTANVKKLREELHHSKEELERARREQQEAKEEYKQLKSVFESFVVESCEREEAYKLVFSRTYEEIEEQKKLCEGLQRQLWDRLPPPVVAAPVVAAPVSPMVAGMDPASLFDIVDGLRSSLSDLEHRLGYTGDAGSRHTTPAALADTSASRATRGRARSAVGVSTARRKGTSHQVQDTSNRHEEQHQHQQQQYPQIPQQNLPGGETGMRLVTPAQGAGALRTTIVVTGSQSTTTERRKRARKKSEGTETAKRLALERPSRTSAASLFNSFTPNTEKPKGGSVVNFGNEPICDYLGLLEKTDSSSSDVLRRELVKFCGNDMDILASYAVEHFLSKSSLTAPVVTLWKHIERVMQIGKDVFFAFMKQAVRKLVCLLGPDRAAEIDHTPHLRCLALAVRMSCVVQVRNTSQCEGALFAAFYECTVSALRSWRLGSSVGEQRHVLGPWMIAVQHLCGFVEEFHLVIHYYANSERVLDALTIRKCITRYAVQAVMASCYFTSSPQSPVTPLESNTNADMKIWMDFCYAMDWSYSELPLNMIGSAAVKILAHSEDVLTRGEALLSLRLLVLQKGFGFLQPLTEELRASANEVDVDGIFAELFSLAVIDMPLEDPCDEEWGRAMAFFADYLSASSVDQAKSTEELLALCKDTHLLVLRAMLQLCHGAGAMTEEGATHLTRALQWMRTIRLGLERSERENKTSAVTGHPFQATSLGQQLRYLCTQEL